LGNAARLCSDARALARALVPSFWLDPWYAAVPVLSALLTVLFRANGVRAKTA
jgi:hypothetical protein